MFLRNKECRRLKINLPQRFFQKQRGQVEWAMGFFLLLFLAIILCTELQLDVYRASALYLEDALAASNLASAIIDLEEYGTTHAILIENPEEAYVQFCEAVKGNLQLNDNWECENKELISGEVRVVNYTVYNVREEQVTVYEIEPGKGMDQWCGTVGSVTAPNGIPIETTSIYSEITFPVEGFGGVLVDAHKGKLVDIVANEEMY